MEMLAGRNSMLLEHMWSLFNLSLEYVTVVLPFFITSIVSFAVLSVNKYTFFIDPPDDVTCKIK